MPNIVFVFSVEFFSWGKSVS